MTLGASNAPDVNNKARLTRLGDRVAYLGLLREQCERHGVLGYCLMTNHIHLVATPAREDSLNLAVGRTHFLYTQSL